MPRKSKRPVARSQSLTLESQLDTIRQTEERNPALHGRLRGMIHRADAGDPQLVLLKAAVVRIGLSVYISRPHFNIFVEMNRGVPCPGPRGNAKVGRRPAESGAA